MPNIPDHPYRMMMIGGSESRKINALLNLIKEQNSDNLIDKIHLYAKDLTEPKYQFLIKNREDVGKKHLNSPKAFIEHSQYMDDVYNNINDNNSTRNRKILIVFDDMIADIMTNKKFFKPRLKNYLLQKIKYISCFYHTILFFSSKRSWIIFCTLLNNKDS